MSSYMHVLCTLFQIAPQRVDSQSAVATVASFTLISTTTDNNSEYGAYEELLAAKNW